MDVLVVGNKIKKVAKNIPTSGSYAVDAKTNVTKTIEVNQPGAYTYTVKYIGGDDPGTKTYPVKVIDGKGSPLMPGLIDMHTHVSLSRGLADMRVKWDAWAGGAMAYEVMKEKFLLRGFTSIRDIGGAALGLSRALKAGVISGPRMWAAGPTISQTAGHGDWSTVNEPYKQGPFVMERLGQTRIVDGVPEVLKAVRTNLKEGAAFIKVMANGGVASDFDPLESYGFTLEELKAAVNAASDYGTYVAVHAYTDGTVNRAIDAGVKVIEHGFMAEEKTIERMAKEDVVFSWQAYASIVSFADLASLPGFTEDHIRKGLAVNANAKKVPGWLKKYGVKVVAGSDLYFYNTLDEVMKDITIKEDFVTPVEALRMHTSTAGEVLAMSGPKNPYKEARVGVIEKGAYADIILFDGNPLKGLKILEDFERMKLVMKDGKIYKNSL